MLKPHGVSGVGNVRRQQILDTACGVFLTGANRFPRVSRQTLATLDRPLLPHVFIGKRPGDEGLVITQVLSIGYLVFAEFEPQALAQWHSLCVLRSSRPEADT